MSKVYTAEEVAQHNNENDLWIIIHGGVYDLTKFLKEHPGGEEVLIDLAGRDGTVCFDDMGHTVEAIKLRETFKIGEVTGTIATNIPASKGTQETTVDDDNWEYQEPKYETTPWLPVIIAGGVAIYAFIFYYFWFS